MQFDDVLCSIGEFGTYQKRLYFLLCLPAISIGLQFMFQIVFLLAVPNHRCMIPGMTNDTYAVQGDNHERLINVSIPYTIIDGKLTYSQCRVFSRVVLSYTNNTLYYDAAQNGTFLAGGDNSTEKCTSWVYDRSVYGSTMSTHLSMVCERRLLTTHSKMIFMAGLFVGALLSGPLSDTFGRKTMVIAGLFGNIGSVCLTWVSSYPMFIALTFVTNVLFSALYLASFVFGTELVGPSKRKYTGIIMNMFWSTGNLIVGVVVYFIRDWKYRQLGFALPGVLLLSYVYVIPESPRWLLMKNKKYEATKIILQMAKVNKSKMSPDVIDSVIGHNVVDQQPFWKLFRSRILLMRCLIIFFNWCAVGMGFYGLSINIVNMSGNVYFNYLIFNVFEFVAYILCLLLVDRIGRKRLYCSAMLISGLACSLTIIPRLVAGGQHTWIITILATIGNTGACVSFATVYLFSSELFPTVARNSGIGYSSMFAKLGSIASPYVADLGWIIGGDFGDNLPLIIFGAVMVSAGLLSLKLPETLNKKLPEIIEDGEMLGRSPPRGRDQELTAPNRTSDSLLDSTLPQRIISEFNTNINKSC